MPGNESNPISLSVAEFRQALQTQPLEKVAQERVFEGLPYVFVNRPEAMTTLRSHLSSKLGVQPENITVIGSAKVGFSLSPDNFPRQFSDDSDIDVLLVDDRMFDLLWLNILKWHYPRRAWLDELDWQWVRDRKNEIYWGWIEPGRIRYSGLSLPEVLRPMRDLSTNWFNAFKSLGRYPEFMSRDVTGRLYRTWDHAKAYQVASLAKIRASIARTKNAE